MRCTYLLLGLLYSLLHAPFAYSDEQKYQAPIFNNLGSFHYPIATSIPAAQRFFDQGLVLYYGFEWGEAIRSFEESARLDPQCAMCYWGMALALGSKMNAPVSHHEYEDARNAIQKATTLKHDKPKIEQGYIDALALRFKHLPNSLKKNNKQSGTFSCHQTDSSNDASTKQEKLNYAKAMEKLIKVFPKDNNIKALYAYALMEWDYWGTFPENMPLIRNITSVLESILKDEPLHIGANHYYIHIIESSSHPEKALASAHRLRTLVPGSEHLIHMPAHIYFLTGRFHQASESNLQAIEVFKQYNQTCKSQGFEPEINYLYFHNYDFLRSSAAMEGRKELAIFATKEMLQSPFSTWLANEPDLQWFIPIPSFMEARFGQWDEILKAPEPDAKYQYAQGMRHYLRGLAFIQKGDSNKAKDENLALEIVIKRGPNNQVFQEKGIKLLTIANLILKASIANAAGNKQDTIDPLKQAMKMQKDMGYHEPPDWYFPVTEALADAYLKWGEPQKAAKLYKQDLKQYPKNGWALFGLAQSLRVLGKVKDANIIDEQFKLAWQHADISKPVTLFPIME